MARMCLIHCVLIQVLFITVYGEITVSCPNQTGTVGEPLQLHCSVTCDNCKSTRDYEWSKVNNPDFSCSDGQKRGITIGKSHTFQCTIPSVSKEHNGTFTFWVQMSEGQDKMTFNVTIVPRAPDPTTPGAVSKAGPSVALGKNRHEAKKDEEPEDDTRSYKIAVVVAVISSFVIVIMVAVLLRRNKKDIVSSRFTHQNIPQPEIT